MHTSEYLQDLVAGWLTGTNFPADPASLELALSETNPLMDGSGFLESSGSGYARQALTLAGPVVSEVDGVQTSNTAEIVFTGAGQANYAVIFDDADNMLFFAPLSQVRNVVDGDTMAIEVGGLVVQLDGMYSGPLAYNVINWMRSSAMPSAPTTTYLALSTANPTRSGDDIAEPESTDNYDRQAIVWDTPAFTNGVGTVLTNSALIVFGPAQTTSWGAITYLAVYDASENGTMLLYAPLAVQRTVPVNEGVGFAVDALSLTIR